MLRTTLRALTAGLLLALPVAAQDCSQMSVTVTDGADTQNVAFDVTGSSASSFHLILVGETAGDVSFDIAGTTLSLGILPPFAAFPLGLSDADGNLSVNFDLPATIDGTFLGQSIGIEFSPPAIGFCTSNVASFTL